MKLVLIALGSVAAFVAIWIWLTSKIHYRIGSKHLKIACLGVVLRKIEFTDIKRISKRKPSRLSENWASTFKPAHRLLAIQRLSGFRRFVIITPRNRYIFLADLQNAIKRARPGTNLESLVEPSDEPSAEEIRS